MTNEERRLLAAARLRDLGHEFVGRELRDETLDAVLRTVDELLRDVRESPVRTRSVPLDSLDRFKFVVPLEGEASPHRFFADSVVSGGANPMGLAGTLWRDGETAVMQVVFANAFEGAPGRAHGGVIAALLDETMGVVMGIHDALGLTAQLDITYLAPAPLNAPVIARAWLESRDGRKITSRATVHCNEVIIAEATALFITVDPQKFLAHLATI